MLEQYKNNSIIIAVIFLCMLFSIFQIVASFVSAPFTLGITLIYTFLFGILYLPLIILLRLLTT